LEMCMRLAAEWDFYYIDEVLTSWRLMPSNHTATLHQKGSKIGDFYDITRKSLNNESVQKMFAGEWEKIERDSMLFCSFRSAVLNGVAAVRSHSLTLFLATIKTIRREDKYASKWLRLPLFALREIFVSIFPRHDPPPRQGSV
jgi:hypothetical protein